MTLPETVNLLPKRVRRQTRDAAKHMLNVSEHRLRPQTCARILGVPEVLVINFGPKTFAQARANWIRLVSEARVDKEEEREKVYNIAWSCLKNWRCEICGGLKRETHVDTCSNECGNLLRRRTRLKRLGPVVLRIHPTKGYLNGRSYRGHGLRLAQVDAMRRALANNEHCVAGAARELGMSYGLAKYYIQKFGGYVNGERTKRKAHL